ncbi:MAG TPA: amidohydrolase, partial [Acidimicrobiales bacterium]|nr:amidohydrolase [Acidimicrobiales bacterium]
PLVAWAVETLVAGGVTEVVVAVPAAERAAFAAALPERVRLVDGGPSRTASVRAALGAVPAGAEAVLVHDAARPLTPPAVVARVLDALAGLPLEVTPGDALSSVTAVLRGGRPGPTVLLRGDMDALPVREAADVPFRSDTDGVMHACGHDLHTAMLVGAAHVLAGAREELAGDVVFMFQPGEEGYDGAGKMLAEGLLDASGSRPQAAYAIHVFSGSFAHGTFATKPGPLMAASDVLAVTVRGAGGHGSAPHRTRDPIPAACEMVTALQTWLSRGIDAQDPVVITVGTFHAGTKNNIIPDLAEFEATVRTFDPAVRDLVIAGTRRVCEGVAAAHGVEVDVRFVDQYPVTVNTEGEVDVVGRTVTELFGADRYAPMARPITGAEDFSRVTAAVPGAMVFLGAMPQGADPSGRPDNHSAEASFDDGVLADGVALHTALALHHLGG